MQPRRTEEKAPHGQPCQQIQRARRSDDSVVIEKLDRRAFLMFASHTTAKTLKEKNPSGASSTPTGCARRSTLPWSTPAGKAVGPQSSARCSHTAEDDGTSEGTYVDRVRATAGKTAEVPQ